MRLSRHEAASLRAYIAEIRHSIGSVDSGLSAGIGLLDAGIKLARTQSFDVSRMFPDLHPSLPDVNPLFAE